MILSNTKAGGNVGCNRFVNRTNSARSSNGCNEGNFWTRIRWSARLAIVSVAEDKIGGLFSFNP